jgi:cardiolipin synthase C
VASRAGRRSQGVVLIELQPMSLPIAIRGRVARLLLALLVVAQTLGCATPAGRHSGAPSTAWADTQDTLLAAVAAASVAQGAATAEALSSFGLLPRGDFAFDARIALVTRAERSVDVQYYHLRPDGSGRALLRALRDAAARGVRVRLLLDDLHAAPIEDLLIDLGAHDNLQVRLFNPLAVRMGPPTVRLLLSPGEFELHNHRMHNKLLVADNALAIFGGRNIGDEYFMSHPDSNFVDLDVLAAGAVVRELSAAFDGYWNSGLAWPVQDLLAPPVDDVAARARFDAAVRDAAPAPLTDASDPLGHAAVSAQLAVGRLALRPGSARVHADPPAKAHDPGPTMGRASVAMQGVLEALAGARHEVGIMSPYFVPGLTGMRAMAEGLRQGVRITLFTNSLASSDEPLVHHRYAAYRVAMLRLGVQIYEFSPELVRRSGGFGFKGSRGAQLHAKVAVVDDGRLVAGSVNLDPRSAVANTEMSVVIDSAPLVADLLRLSHEKSPRTLMYSLRLQPDGRTVEWLSRDDQGREVATIDEPGSSAWLQLKLWLQSLVVGERLL